MLEEKILNEQVLSKRLMRVGENVPQDAHLADIGSDHAYLPTYLMLKGKIKYAVAGEVVQGPYESALKQVAKNQLSHQIAVRLANGLAAIQPEDHISAITIAGMGGSLIRQILTDGLAQGQLRKEETLILQPNIGEMTLRQWLISEEYQICHEEILEENQKIYEIIVAIPNQKVTYSEKELFFGPCLLKERNAIFIKKWTLDLENKKRVLAQLLQAQTPPKEKIEEVKKQIQWIEEVLF